MHALYTPLLARIDDRLIHGQVVVGCCEPLGAKRILLVDDPVLNAELTRDFDHDLEDATRVQADDEWLHRSWWRRTLSGIANLFRSQV